MAGISFPKASVLRLILVVSLAGCASSGTAEATSGPAATANQPADAVEGPPSSSESEGAGATTDPARAPDPAASAGVFTEAQSDRGRTTFNEVCSECHTTSEFRGRTFQNNWGRRTVYSFFRTIRSTMPDDNPGGLEEQVYLDVVSYILSINGHGPGPSELAADSPMREVRIAPPAPAR